MPFSRVKYYIASSGSNLLMLFHLSLCPGTMYTL